MKNDRIVTIKHMLMKVICNPFSEWLVTSFCVGMFTFAFVLRDWLGMLITCYPVNLLLVYYITKKQISKFGQGIILLSISILYLLYIWTPLTDGTVGQLMREIRNG